MNTSFFISFWVFGFEGTGTYQESAVKRVTTKVQLDLQHCCKMSWLAMLRVLPPTRKYLATLFVMGGKARNIAIQLVLQHCCKTSCTFLLLFLLWRKSEHIHSNTFYSLQIDCGFEISGHATAQRRVYFGFAHLPSSIPKTTVYCFDCCFFPVYEIMIINLAKERKSELTGA